MPAKKSKKQGPVKLTSYYTPTNKEPNLNQASTSSLTPKDALSPTNTEELSGCSPLIALSSRYSTLEDPETNMASTSSDITHVSSPSTKTADMSLLPAAMENTLRSLFQEFRESLNNDLMASINGIVKDVADLGGRTANLENKIDKLATIHNALVDNQDDITTDVFAIKLKLADLEDRSRRNNIRFRGIPEEVQTSELRDFLIDFFTILLPHADQRDMIIDRVHRIPKPSHLPPTTPRDVLARLHFFHFKEAIFRKAKNPPSLPERFGKIVLFTDLSAMTLKRRKAFSQMTSFLRDKEIPYRWGFPVKLLIHRNGTTHALLSPKDASKFLQNWFPDTYIPPEQQAPKRKAENVTQEWTTVGRPPSSSSSPKTLDISPRGLPRVESSVT